MEKKRNSVTVASTITTSLTSLDKNSLEGDIIYPTVNVTSNYERERQQEKDIDDLKNLSVCTKTYTHPTIAKNILVCSQPTEFPEIYGEDESAKDCL